MGLQLPTALSPERHGKPAVQAGLDKASEHLEIMEEKNKLLYNEFHSWECPKEFKMVFKNTSYINVHRSISHSSQHVEATQVSWMGKWVNVT